MGFAWMALIAYARELFSRTCLPAWLEVGAAALWTTAIDLVIDPLAANQLGYWRWSGAGIYYGIPFTNFIGWFVVSLIAHGLFRRRLGRNFPALVVGFAIVLFFTLIALANSLLIAALIGFALCVAQLPIIALTRDGEREGLSAPMQWRRGLPKS
jgi:putative membrane protein